MIRVARRDAPRPFDTIPAFRHFGARGPQSFPFPSRVNRPPNPVAANSRFWTRLVKPLLSRRTTPFYLFSIVPIQEALSELESHFGHLPILHWLSFKTQPLRPLIQWWRDQGRPVEVVSEFEFRAALAEGFAPQQILINGPAKHRWLPKIARRGLRVNFDSPTEARLLAPMARRLNWTCGIRLLTREEFDPESPGFATQFGFTPDEAAAALGHLTRQKVKLE